MCVQPNGEYFFEGKTIFEYSNLVEEDGEGRERGKYLNTIFSDIYTHLNMQDTLCFT